MSAKLRGYKTILLRVTLGNENSSLPALDGIFDGPEAALDLIAARYGDFHVSDGKYFPIKRDDIYFTTQLTADFSQRR